MRGVVEPGPAAAAGEVADVQAEREALRVFGGVEQPKGIAAGGIGAQSEADAQRSHQVRRCHRIALPLAGDRVVADRGAGVGQHAQLMRCHHGRVSDQHLRPERAQMVQQFQRPPAAPDQRTLDRGKMLVDVRLEDGARLGAHVGHGDQHLVGGRLGHRDRKRGMNQGLPLPAPQELRGAIEYLLAQIARAVVAAVIANQAQHAAQPRLLRGGRQHADVTLGAGAGIADGREAAAQRFERGDLARLVDELVVQAGLQRHPDAAENLRGLAGGERFAERLGEVMVRVDEARHQQPAGQFDRRDVRMAGAQRGRRPDVLEAAAAHQRGVSADAAIAQHELLGKQQQFGRAAGPVLVRAGGFAWPRLHALRAQWPAGVEDADAGFLFPRRAAPMWLNSRLRITAVIAPIARPLPSTSWSVGGNLL